MRFTDTEGPLLVAMGLGVLVAQDWWLIAVWMLVVLAVGVYHAGGGGT